MYDVVKRRRPNKPPHTSTPLAEVAPNRQVVEGQQKQTRRSDDVAMSRAYNGVATDADSQSAPFVLSVSESQMDRVERAVDEVENDHEQNNRCPTVNRKPSVSSTFSVEYF